MPLTIAAINQETGQVLLSDGTRWTASRDDTWVISAWQARHRVTLHGDGVYRRMENLACDSSAEFVKASSEQSAPLSALPAA